ncbi:hypothetical protein [Pengzhenrongella frigida]|uniref:Uncharacterized protein n=1 Tax=Pengzhenrongella frigida TaxID=1259133 RepID=A0A4Q5N7P8_9MICO|nr:hypothetical protein [Cellulomonas sp. HLT2-17]RYV52591.1 hypothetical protein EUA98_02515 [Cellulomonas sp. HLT2-17]
MSTQQDQRYLVHLDMLADAFDPNDAVEAVMVALERLGGLANFIYRVEEVGTDSRAWVDLVRVDSTSALAGQKEGLGTAVGGSRFPGEFLG